MTPRKARRYPENRLREVREYLGLSIEEVAGFLGAPTGYILLYEEGIDWPSVAWEKRLASLLQRPIAYLRGEAAEPVEVTQELDALLSRTTLTPNDRAEVLDFVQFLQHRAAAPRDPTPCPSPSPRTAPKTTPAPGETPSRSSTDASSPMSKV